MKRLLPALVLACLAAQPVAAEQLIIDDIIEAQYSGCEGADAGFKRKTLMNVTKACVGRSSCRMVSRVAADDMNCSKLIVTLACSDGEERTFVRRVSDGVMSFNCK